MQAEVLYKLIDAISDLVRHHGLQTSTKGDAVQALARAHLFVALRQLDGIHKGLALQFLYEANLIGSHAIAEREPTLPVIALNGADLAGLSLPNANFGWAHLAVADIARAQLHNACLIRANLYAVDLIDADLSHANLTGANLFMADITNANLDGADLRSAFVSPAQLASARITGTTRLPDGE
jgi:uncharacterized protein YjbI with pentapeptide repeats